MLKARIAGIVSFPLGDVNAYKSAMDIVAIDIPYPTENEYACRYNVNGTTVNEATAYKAPIARIAHAELNASVTGANVDDSFVDKGTFKSPPRMLKISWLWLRPSEGAA